MEQLKILWLIDNVSFFLFLYHPVNTRFPVMACNNIIAINWYISRNEIVIFIKRGYYKIIVWFLTLLNILGFIYGNTNISTDLYG